MDVAASLAAFIGLTQEVVLGIIQVYNFVQDVKKAPEAAKKLKRELELLQDIVSSFAIQERDSALVALSTAKAVEDALRLIKDTCESLSKVLRKNLSAAESSRTKKLLDNINSVFQNKKVTKLIGELERAKGSLQLAYQLAER